MSTEHIGLAEFSGGVSLVRVGNPLRPELVAWRYGRQLGWRRLRTGIAVGAGLAAAAALGLGGISIGLGIVSVYAALGAGAVALEGVPTRVVATVPHKGMLLRIKRADLPFARLFPDDQRGGYALVLHHTKGVDILGGSQSRYALTKLFPAINRFGANRDTLNDATSLLEEGGDSDAYIQWLLRRASNRVLGSLTDFPEAASLALEIALQEDTERRALEGELAELEEAWREAEAIASIADNLLVPASVLRQVEQLRRLSNVNRAT